MYWNNKFLIQLIHQPKKIKTRRKYNQINWIFLLRIRTRSIENVRRFCLAIRVITLPFLFFWCFYPQSQFEYSIVNLYKTKAYIFFSSFAVLVFLHFSLSLSLLFCVRELISVLLFDCCRIAKRPKRMRRIVRVGFLAQFNNYKANWVSRYKRKKEKKKQNTNEERYRPTVSLSL